MSVKITKIQPDGYFVWDDYVENNPETMSHHLSGWRNNIGKMRPPKVLPYGFESLCGVIHRQRAKERVGSIRFCPVKIFCKKHSEANLTGEPSALSSRKRFVLPWGGGGYFRLLPYRFFRHGVQTILKKDGAYMFYMHPWELDH